MATNGPLLTTDLQPSLALVNKGKVRDMYKVDEKTLLIITTDRVSAFGKHLLISLILSLLFDKIDKTHTASRSAPEASLPPQILPNSRTKN